MTINEFIDAEFDKYGKEAREYLDEIVDAVKEKFGVSCDYEHIGGFDSPGYEIESYAIAYVDTDGKVGIYGYNYEIY